VRRAGVITLALLFGSIVVTLFLAHLYRLSVAQTSVAILIGGGTPAGVYLAWAAYRDSQDREVTLTLGAIADELATAVAAQWEREAAVRRLNDPYPLPVRWVPADPPLSDEWDALVTLASSGAGWPGPATVWAAEASELAGSGNQLADVLDRVPTGRLVILGEPGSGKTMLMVRLVLDLLQRRSKGDAVPVLVSAASWNPMAQDFYSWLTGQLVTAHPALAAPYSSASGRISRVEALMQARLVMPILDGFDELPDGVRRGVIADINGQLRSGERLIMTSRTAEYRAATRPAVGPEITLAAAAVELCALDIPDVITYLRQSAGGPRSASRWEPVFTELVRSRDLARVLSNPLMVGLARVIYNPRPDEQTYCLPDPAELCAFSSKESIEGHLLDAFIPAAYRPTGGRGSAPHEWNAELADRRFTFLADYLERVIREPGLSWWDLNVASPAMTHLASGLIAGLAVGIPVTLIPILLVITSYIRVRIAAMPGYPEGFFNQLGSVLDIYWERIVEITLFFGIVGGIASLAVAFGPRSSQPIKSIFASWNGWTAVAARVVGLLNGVAFSLLIYLAVQSIFSWPHYLVVLGALTVGLAAGWGSANERFRNGTPPVIVVGAIVGTPFYLYMGFSRAGYGNIGLPVGLVVGLLAGLAAGLAVLVRGQNWHYPSRSIRWRPRSVFSVLAAGAAITLLTALATGQISVGLIFGAAVGLGAVVIVGLERVPGDLRIAASPGLVLKRDRSATLALCLVTAFAAGLIVGIGTLVVSTSELLADISPVSDAVIFGLTIGPTVGFALMFALSGYGSAWPQWVFARQTLAIRRATPRRLLAFLEDSHARGVLRQVGPVYQFRHIELQHRLASRVTGSASPTWLQQVAVSARWQEHQAGAHLRPFEPLDDKRSQRRGYALRITAVITVLAVAAASATVLDRGAITRIGGAGQHSSTLVPVVTCPASGDFNLGSPPARGPATKSAPVPPDLGGMLAYYTDPARFIPTILGPRGWVCSAGVGVDGSWSIDIYPRGKSPTGPIGVQARGPSCIGCVFSLVCPLIPHATAELSYPGQCSGENPARQVVSWIVGSPNFSQSGIDVVSIVDPPGVKGYVASSGGLYFSRGMLFYYWGQPIYYYGFPETVGAYDALMISCTLPDADSQLCQAAFAVFRQQVWTNG
jgi:GTPase SAR1 family protein